MNYGLRRSRFIITRFFKDWSKERWHFVWSQVNFLGTIGIKRMVGKNLIGPLNNITLNTAGDNSLLKTI